MTVTSEQNYAKAVGLRIKAARAMVEGMTQQKLAEAIGTNRRMVIDIEGGRRSLKLHEVLRLASVLNCSVAWIVCGPKIAEVSLDDEGLKIDWPDVNYT